MRIEFDPVKSIKNARERGLPFDVVSRFDFQTAVRARDLRRDYGEERWLATGFIGTRLHVLCFVWVGDSVRIISLRKANAREIKRYDKETTSMDE